METKLLIDNWMLQDVKQALENGLSEDISGEISIDTLNDTHDFNSVPHAVFQIDALLSLLTKIYSNYKTLRLFKFGGKNIWAT